MKNRFQLGFVLGSLLPLAALCALGHSERVAMAAGGVFLLIPALLWPRRVSGWLLGLGEFYERVTLRPARSGRRKGSVSGPGDIVIETLVKNYRCPKGKAKEIAARVARIPDENERVFAAIRMVRT